MKRWSRKYSPKSLNHGQCEDLPEWTLVQDQGALPPGSVAPEWSADCIHEGPVAGSRLLLDAGRAVRKPVQFNVTLFT